MQTTATTRQPARPRGRKPKDVVRRLRMDARLSQYELARRTGLSRSLICEIESGRRGVTHSSRTLIAGALDVSPEQIPVSAA